MLSAIFAMSRNGVIGKEGGLPWNLPDDFAYFKKTTLGHPIIMGRKTFESLGRPLPGRTNIVLTRSTDFKAPGCEVCHTFEDVAHQIKDQDAFVIGGAEIYELFDGNIDKLYVTIVEADVEGDTYYHNPQFFGWQLESETAYPADERNPIPRTVKIFEKLATQPQFEMKCESFDNLPAQNIPEGYELQVFQPGDEHHYVNIIRESFGGDNHDYETEVIKHVNYIPDGTFLIFHTENGASEAVATATAIIDPSPENKYGYLHMVGAFGGHKGKRLGYEVSLACLLKMQAAGKTGCTLKTDDFRLPAIVTYLKLGFAPDIKHENQVERWRQVMAQIGRHA